MRGYNLSDRPTGADNYKISYMVDDLRALIEHLSEYAGRIHNKLQKKLAILYDIIENHLAMAFSMSLARPKVVGGFSFIVHTTQ